MIWRLRPPHRFRFLSLSQQRGRASSLDFAGRGRGLLSLWLVSPLLTFIFLPLFLWGCGGKNAEDPIAARVGKATITRSELINLYGLDQDFLTGGGEVDTTILVEAARRWALEEILIQEAQRRGLDRDSTFQIRLENIRREILIGQLFEESNTSIAVDSLEIRQEYEKHREEYTSAQDEVDLTYIVAPTRELANQARQKLRSGLALTDILIQNAQLSGKSVGWVAANDLNPTISRTAFAMAPGTISNPIKIESGEYIILQCHQRRQAGTVLPLEEVREDIRGRVILRKKLETEKALKNRLWISYNPQIFVNSSE